MNNTPQNIVCETTNDVLNHKIVLNSLIETFNEFCDVDNVINRHEELDEDDRKNLDSLIEHISEDDLLYTHFLDILRAKYSKFNGMYPNVIERKHIFALLTTLDYIRETLSSLPILLANTNKELIDIMNYDTHLGKDSNQLRRQVLMKAGVPLVDENGFEIVDFDSEYDPEYILNNDIGFSSYRFFAASRDFDGDERFLIGQNGRIVKNVDPYKVDNIIISLGGTLIQIEFGGGVMRDSGEILKDSDGNKIVDVNSIAMIGEDEYYEVVSKGNKDSYYINSSTLETLFIDEEKKRKVKSIRSYNDKNGLYQVLDQDSNICYLDHDLIEQTLTDQKSRQESFSGNNRTLSIVN